MFNFDVKNTFNKIKTFQHDRKNKNKCSADPYNMTVGLASYIIYIYNVYMPGKERTQYNWIRFSEFKLEKEHLQSDFGKFKRLKTDIFNVKRIHKTLRFRNTKQKPNNTT